MALTLMAGRAGVPALAQGTTGGGIPPGYMVIEGDIIVPTNFYDPRRPLAAYTTNTWPDGLVYFEFDSSVSSANQRNMLNAMQQWIGNAEVAFVPRTGWESSRVHLQNSTANNSSVGRQAGQQVVNIFNWDHAFIVAHELCHALGFWHEQSRPDRDTFVLINTLNETGQEHSFDIHPEASTFGPYGFDSVMHYGHCDFSNCCTAGCTCATPGHAMKVMDHSKAQGATIGKAMTGLKEDKGLVLVLVTLQ